MITRSRSMDLKNYHLRKVCKFWLRHSRHKTKYVMKCMHSVIIEARSPEFDLCRWPANSTDRDSPRGTLSINLYQISKNQTYEHSFSHFRAMSCLQSDGREGGAVLISSPQGCDPTEKRQGLQLHMKQ